MSDKPEKFRVNMALMIEQVQLAADNVRAAAKLNRTMQEKTIVGSPDWHMHEAIDDKLHDALRELGE